MQRNFFCLPWSINFLCIYIYFSNLFMALRWNWWRLQEPREVEYPSASFHDLLQRQSGSSYSSDWLHCSFLWTKGRNVCWDLAVEGWASCKPWRWPTPPWRGPQPLNRKSVYCLGIWTPWKPIFKKIIHIFHVFVFGWKIINEKQAELRTFRSVRTKMRAFLGQCTPDFKPAKPFNQTLKIHHDRLALSYYVKWVFRIHNHR